MCRLQRYFGSDQSVWRDGDWNGFVGIALAGLLASLVEALRGAGTTDRVATDRVIVAFGLARDVSNGTSAAISRCGVTAIGTAL